MGVSFESGLTLFDTVVVVLLRAEWDVLLMTEVLSPRHLNILFHLINADKSRRDGEL